MRFPNVFATLVLCLFMWLPLTSSAATACCDGLCVSDLAGQIADVQKTLKQAQIEYVKTNMKDFCQRNLMLRFLNVHKEAPDDPYVMPLSELEAVVDSKQFNYEMPWELTLRSTEDTRNRAITAFLQDIEAGSPDLKLGHKWAMNLDDLGKIMAVPDPASKQKLEEISTALNSSEKVSSDDVANGSTRTQTLKAAACLEISVLKISDCVKALDVLQKEMSPITMPGGGAPIVDKRLWSRVLKDNKYDEGIRLASLKLIDRIKNKKTDNANIFDDLKSSFVQSGLSAKAADEATWDVLAMTSSGGPNTHVRLSRVEGSPPSQRGMGIGFIAVAMSTLDYMKMKSGKGMYSYPANIKTNCDNAKSYHFWMASHMARTLVKDYGYSPETAEQAAFITLKAYQMKRSMVAGKTSGPFAPKIENDGQKLIESDSYSPVQQVVRTDLAFAAAGAVHGARSSQNKSINVDHIIEDLMTDSNDLKSGGRSKEKGIVATYLRFRGLYSPNSALESAGK